MMTSDSVERMFRVLVRALRANRPALLSAPFSVGDLHQQILPYRHFRRDLGLETNQEYELTLMRLLSGAGGYLDPDDRLRDALGAELATNAPEPSRVRDYADAQVSISPSALAALGEDRPRAPESPSPRPSEMSCRYCAGALPQGRDVHYCPHCGQNLQVHNCPACGAELETEWKFCVACGKSVQ